MSTPNNRPCPQGLFVISDGDVEDPRIVCIKHEKEGSLSAMCFCTASDAAFYLGEIIILEEPVQLAPVRKSFDELVGILRLKKARGIPVDSLFVYERSRLDPLDPDKPSYTIPLEI